MLRSTHFISYNTYINVCFTIPSISFNLQYYRHIKYESFTHFITYKVVTRWQHNLTKWNQFELAVKVNPLSFWTSLRLLQRAVFSVIRSSPIEFPWLSLKANFTGSFNKSTARLKANFHDYILFPVIELYLFQIQNIIIK